MLGVVKDKKGKEHWGCVTKSVLLSSHHDEEEEEEEVEIEDNCKDGYFWENPTLNCTKCSDVYEDCDLCDNEGCLTCKNGFFAHNGNCVVDTGSNCKEPMIIVPETDSDSANDGDNDIPAPYADGTCKTCPIKYGFSEDGKCNLDCSIDGDLNCLSCIPGEFRRIQCTQCPIGSYVDHNGFCTIDHCRRENTTFTIKNHI